MTPSHSLRHRVVRAFTVFAVVLITVMLVSTHVVFHFSEDSILVKQLEAELEHLESHPELLEQPVIELGRFITAYVGLDGAGELRHRLEGLKPGKHELGHFRIFGPDEEIHVVVKDLAGRQEKLYLVHDATSLQTVQYRIPLSLATICAGLLMAGLAGTFTGWILAGVVIRPVTSLVDTLRSGSLDEIADAIEPARYGEEVGVLAAALRDAAVRLRGFVAREREFTANASHELRTPVTVIRGAAELLRKQIGDQKPALHKPLARIERAVAAMEETVEVFLAVAREAELKAPVEGTFLADAVSEVVEQHRHLVADRPVGIVVRVPETLRIEAPPRALAIVLGNLVANAFRRTLQGSVTIAWHEGRLEVVDTGPGVPEHILGIARERHLSTDQGHGLGLSIANALCDRFGWRLELVGAAGTGTRAILSF
jgi:signal transduction histidine kinase